MKEKFWKWWYRKNITFSAIAGETFTNGQVVLTHVGLIVFLAVLTVFGD